MRKETLISFLSLAFHSHSRAELLAVIKGGGVSVNKKVVKDPDFCLEADVELLVRITYK